MGNKYSLSVIIPVYNEIELLEKSVQLIDVFISNNFNDYEIIIIESGSTDGSDKACDILAANISSLIMIHEGKRNGFGSALKLGYKYATKDLVWVIPPDIPFPLDSILMALPLFTKYDFVISYRSKDNRMLLRKTQSVIYNILVKTALDLKVEHVNSAFKVFKRGLIQKIPLVSNGWFIDAETLFRLKQKNILFAEIPVPLINRTVGQSFIKYSTFFSVLKEFLYFFRIKDQ